MIFHSIRNLAIAAAIGAAAMFGAAPKAEARVHVGINIISGYASCGCPIYKQRYIRGYYRCGTPYYGYRAVPFRCRCNRGYNHRRAHYNHGYHYDRRRDYHRRRHYDRHHRHYERRRAYR